jgi:hypothetical protein
MPKRCVLGSAHSRLRQVQNVTVVTRLRFSDGFAAHVALSEME